MAYTTINKSSEHFDTKIYTGNGSSQTLDMDNLGLLWMKNRTEVASHRLFDSVRGGYYTSAPAPILSTDNTGGGNGSDVTSTYGITFGSSSSTIGSDGGGYNYNQNGKSYVGWQWRANGSGSSNTDGSITSTVSANTTAGFSIVSYTGTGANATVGHGLGVVPKCIIFKDIDTSSDWRVYHQSIGNTGTLKLNSTDATQTNSAFFNNTSPTSSVFTLGTGTDVNNTNDFIAYCFAEKTGYSKFGSYTGNGNADGPFVYTGFKPAFVMIKMTSTADNWIIQDNKRNAFNISTSNRLRANSSGAEFSSVNPIDLYSNGFKAMSGSDGEFNGSGSTYIYMAIGQSLVGSNNVPCTAR